MLRPKFLRAGYSRTPSPRPLLTNSISVYGLLAKPSRMVIATENREQMADFYGRVGSILEKGVVDSMGFVTDPFGFFLPLCEGRVGC